MICLKCSKQYFCQDIDKNKKTCKNLNKFTNLKNYGEIRKVKENESK